MLLFRVARVPWVVKSINLICVLHEFSILSKCTCILSRPAPPCRCDADHSKLLACGPPPQWEINHLLLLLKTSYIKYFGCVPVHAKHLESKTPTQAAALKHTHTHTLPPWEDQCEWQRMTRMTGPDCAVMCWFSCVFFLFILDIKFVGRTSRGHTGGRPHRISHPPSFCGACLNFLARMIQPFLSLVDREVEFCI